MSVLLLASANAWAAQIAFVGEAPGDTDRIEITGEIRTGDYERLITLIKKEPKKFFDAGVVKIASSGGSVSEALKIAQLVERASLVTMVDNICAGACFLVFISGDIRVASGSVLLHHPYLTAGYHRAPRASKSSRQKNEDMANLLEHLKEHKVPAHLILPMMNSPSTEAHEITEDDMADMGLLSQRFENSVVMKCGTSEKSILAEYATPEQLQCVKNLRATTRLEFMKGFLGEQQAKDLMRDYLAAMGAAGAGAVKAPAK
jgi:hypothetical protein